MSIASGKMTERVTFQSKATTRNSIGEEVVTWTDVATVWAEARPLRGQEFYAANSTQQTVDVRFFIRTRTGLTVDMRLLWKSAPYDITGLIPGTGPYRGALEIMATNGLRNGRGEVVASQIPVNTVAPVISGDLAFGSVLTSTTGTWTGTPTITYTYQWRADGTNISGETASTYTTLVGDVGKSITCRVTATNSAGSASANSNSITVIPTFNPETDQFANGNYATIFDPSDIGSSGTVFQDAAGLVHVTAVEQEVARINDKNGEFKVDGEIITNQADRDFSSDTGYWQKFAVTISGGACVFSAVANGNGLAKSGILTSSKIYRITFDITEYTSGGVRSYARGTRGATHSAVGSYSDDLTAGASDAYLIFETVGTTTLKIDNVSVKEVVAPFMLFTHAALLSDFDGQYYVNYSTTDTTTGALDISLTRDFYYCEGVEFTVNDRDCALVEMRRTGGSVIGDSLIIDYGTEAEHQQDKTIKQLYPATLSVTDATARPYYGQRFVASVNNDYDSGVMRTGDHYTGSTATSRSLTAKNFVPAVGTMRIPCGYNQGLINAKLYGFIHCPDSVTPAEEAGCVAWMKQKTILTPYNIPRGAEAFAPMDTNSTYDAFGFGMQADNGTHLYFARRSATAHVDENGAIHKWTLSGGTWSSTAIVNTAYDDRDAAGGKTSSGAICLFYARYDTPNWVDINVIRSTDHSVNWSSPVGISDRGMTEYSPYGPIVEFPSGRLMQTIYGWNGSVNKLWVVFSDDDGVTWGSPVDIYSGTGYHPTEAAAAYVSGTSNGSVKLVVVSRVESDKLRQYTSSDGGQTWTDAGTLTFSQTSGAVAPWLLKEGGDLILCYTDRYGDNNCFRHTYGNAEAIHSDKSAWHFPEITVNAQNSVDADYGYSSLYKADNGAFVYQFYDSASGTPNIYSSYP